MSNTLSAKHASRT